MNAAEWMTEEAAIRYIARAGNYRDVLARKKLRFAAGGGWIAVMDREGYVVEPSVAMGLEEAFFSRVDLESMFPLRGAAKAETPTPKAPPKNVGGRSTKHGWAEAAGFLAWYIVQWDPDKADAVAAVERWFREEKDKAPDHRELEKFVSAALQEWGRRK